MNDIIFNNVTKPLTKFWILRRLKLGYGLEVCMGRNLFLMPTGSLIRLIV
ncbi:hypothetical protein Lalb_Chr04g0255381 [Lupinus albus]|uniref:Uncharacterized protein n=1 Tax=Lupinus albus TaxID=3870 RepID=A0A6A4QPT1_LUPAL|nr:hypothetical protein Lalb_Chr04g0255381 [Lupinus albus]